MFAYSLYLLSCLPTRWKIFLHLPYVNTCISVSEVCVWFVAKRPFWKETTFYLKVKMYLLFKKTKKQKKGGEGKKPWKTNVCLQGLNRVKEALCVDSALNYESEPALRLLLLTLNTPSLDGCFHQKSVPTPTPAACSGSNLKWCAAAWKSQHSVSQWRKARLDFSG